VFANAPNRPRWADAEHTLALMLSLCRNVARAHASMIGGAGATQVKGTELYGKTRCVGFGRAPELVAKTCPGLRG